MSVTNESRIRSWFQFTSKSSNTSNSSNANHNNTNNASNGGSNGFDDDNSVRDQIECQSVQSQSQTSQQTSTSGTNTSILERVTSFRRSLGKAQNKKHKIRPNSVKGLTSGAVEQPIVAKSKSFVRKASSPTSVVATSGASATSANCDDDEIYGFTSANFDTCNSSTRRQLKSSFQSSNPSNAPNASIAPNINVYESESNKSGRVRTEDRDRDESHAITISANATATTGAKGVSQDSPERLKCEKELSFYNQQTFDSIQTRLYYKQQFFHDSDVNIRHSSTQHLSWIEPINSETDDIDRIYENMRGLSTTLTSAQPRQHNHRNTCNSNNLYVNSVNNNNRKLTKDSGYESASASISNWTAINANNVNALSNNYFHSRSDSNTSSVSTGGSLSPRTAANKSAYHYCDQWSAAKSTSNLPLQVQVSGNRRSSLTGSTHPYPEHIVNTGKSVLPAKSVPGNLDKDSDESVVKKRSHNRNNPTPSSVYSLLASKSGFDFAPVLKSSRRSCGPSFAENPIVSKYNERILSKKVEQNDRNSSQIWKTREKNIIASYGQDGRYEADDSPPPTPPVRDSSLASNRKFSSEIPESEAQNKLMADSLTKGPIDCGIYYKNNNSKYYMRSCSESRVSHMGYSKSLINLRSKYDESSDLKQSFSQTYPLLPETEFNDSSQLHESWSCDQSVTSGVTSLVTTSDYFTASSSVITHSPSLSSLSTTATNTTTASYNNSRNSISSTGSSSQIAKSSKVVQPKRESASVLYSEKPVSLSSTKSEVPPPPPPPPKLKNLGDYLDKDSGAGVRACVTLAPKMVSTSRSVESSKTPHRASDPEIKAIQKRALLQFYLKQKQKEKLENSINISSNSNAAQTTTTPEDNIQVPSRKVHLIVRENIYENSSSAKCITSQPSLPSPPLPPPPQTVADIEFVADLPLPPPPLTQECEPETTTTTILNHNHSLSHTVDICEPLTAPNGQQLGRSPSPPKEPSSPVPPTALNGVSSKSEIATQTTETLRRNSGSASVKDITLLNESSLENSEPMYPNPVPTALITTVEQSGANKSIELVESVAPWAYSKLWPNEKCVKTTHYDNKDNHLLGQSSSPIALAHTLIVETGVDVEPSNDDVLSNKSEIISRLTRKLDILRSEEMALSQDIDSNETLGQDIRTKLKSSGLSTQESEKINLHCDETEKVTRLLLSISAQLQRIENQINDNSRQKCKSSETECKLNSIENSIQQTSNTTITQNDLQPIRDKQNAFSSNLFDEMQSLVSKRQILLLKLEEALQLRVSIDQRNRLIEDKILSKYFKHNNQYLNEFREFIKLKSKLIVDIRQVRDRIQMGERHLYALRTS